MERDYLGLTNGLCIGRLSFVVFSDYVVLLNLILLLCKGMLQCFPFAHSFIVDPIPTTRYVLYVFSSSCKLSVENVRAHCILREGTMSFAHHYSVTLSFDPGSLSPSAKVSLTLLALLLASMYIMNSE